MRFLLDTHTFLWFITGDDQLGGQARDILDDIENEIMLSVASLWEIAIKVSLGKLELQQSFADLVPRQLLSNEIGLLPIDPRHLTVLVELPFHHRDPFDRLLIAQAISEGLPVLSGDEAFRDYSVQVLW